jgi:integrase/recombinase XerD
MNEEGHHPEVLKISKLKVEKKVFRTFSEPQLRLIVSHKPKGFHETRIHVLLLLLIDTGIRIDEALTAQSSRVDFDNLLITVRGKGNKERIIPFSIELRKHLFKFLRHGKRYVFPVRSGNHLEYHNARRSFKALMVKLGINGVDGAFHASRRCFARTYLRKGGNLHYLKNVLGHEDIKTTEGYLDDDTRALQAIHQNVSPLSTLRV